MNGDVALDPEDFFIVAREPGAEHPALPTWANRSPDPVNLAAQTQADTQVRYIDEVPGTFQLLNLLSVAECQRFIDITEQMAYLPDAAVSLPRKIRHNDNVTWVVDQATSDLLWQRCSFAFQSLNVPSIDKPAVGLNARFRFYKYARDDYFAPHTDGAWFGSAVINDQLIGDAFGDRYSIFSLVIFLSDGFEGGRTEFYLNPDDPFQAALDTESAEIIKVATPRGAAICFPHGGHPWHRVHSSEIITRGVKYIIRTDVLFAL